MSRSVALRYPNKRISSLTGLSLALGVPLHKLQDLAGRTSALYRPNKPVEKPGGGFRQTYDAHMPLKRVQQRIQAHFLVRVIFPEYLTGSIRGRDAIRNAALHAGAHIIVCEDIQGFFPNTTAVLVNSIWKNFFGFEADVACLLTALTTKEGALPEGAVTSPYLANLAFWDREPAFHERFAKKGIVYSRYVDDIAVSAKHDISKAELTWCISQVYGMMRSCGYSAKRGKHEIQRGHARMFTTKVMVNTRPALTKAQRHAARAAVHQLELRSSNDGEIVSSTDLNRVAGRVGRVARLHRTEGTALKKRVSAVRRAVILAAE